MTQLAKRSGVLFILSAPSGAGKTTLTNGLRAHYPDIKLSVSCTTRARRNGEVPGRDYHFVSEQRFAAMRSRGEFAESAQVHDHFYGTPRAPLDRCLKAGHDMLLDIDVKGAQQIKALYPDAVLVFLLPPSGIELERRLRLRGTDDPEVIRRRLANAQDEIRRVIHYDYYIVNRDVEAAVATMKSIIEAERARTSRVLEWRLDTQFGRKRL
jgi:guanylate kinase